MKNLILVCLIVFTTWSCSKDDKFGIDNYPQKWTLIEMSGQIPNSETTGDDMEWQEYYLLKPDGTFIKHRERDGIDYEAIGIFTFVDESDGKYLELNYNSDNEIIGSCYANQTESLWLKSDHKLHGTWSYCDGPGLEYERTE